jgi:hypothetical protein
MSEIKLSGKFHGKSNAIGHGGRAAQLAQAAPGKKNYHGVKKPQHKKHSISFEEFMKPPKHGAMSK